MRTTIDLPDSFFRRIKAAASLDGKTLKAYITEALEAKINETGSKGSGRRTRFPLVKSINPGSINLDGTRVADYLEDEDIRASD